MTDPDPTAPRDPKGLGRYALFGTLIAIVLVPFAVFWVMEIINDAVFECYDNGAEGSLSCSLRQLAITVLSIPVGAVIGFMASTRIGERRLGKTGGKT